LAFVGVGTEFLSLSTYAIDFIHKAQVKKVKRHDTARSATFPDSEEQGPIPTEVDEKGGQKFG
jgi:hypothetical protein